MEFVKLAAFAIASAIFALNFKNIKNEYGVFITIAACIIIFQRELKVVFQICLWNYQTKLKKIMEY